MWSSKQRAQYYANAKAKRDAIALAEGRVPGRVGQPPKYTEEERRELRRVKTAKWRSENLERSREITRECEKRRAVSRAIAEGRLPGKKGKAKIHTEVEKRALKNARTKKAYYSNIERSRELAAKGARERRVAKAAGTYVPKKQKGTEEQRALVNRVHSANRRDLARKNGGKYTKDDIIRLMAEQEGKCAICSTAFGDDGYHVDHYIPLSKGGSNDPSNLKLTHPVCNLKKGAKLPDEITIGKDAA